MKVYVSRVATLIFKKLLSSKLVQIRILQRLKDSIFYSLKIQN
jgi:hypothetical protein